MPPMNEVVVEEDVAGDAAADVAAGVATTATALETDEDEVFVPVVPELVELEPVETEEEEADPTTNLVQSS